MDPRHSPFASLTHEVEDDDSEEYSPQVTNVPYAIALPLEGEMAGRPEGGGKECCSCLSLPCRPAGGEKKGTRSVKDTAAHI